MPNNDGEKPGGNDNAENKSDTNDANAGGKKAGTKSGEGNDDDAGEKPAGEKVVTMTQAEFDRTIQNRVSRATKRLEDDAKLTKEQILEKERDEALSQVRERDLKDEFTAAAGIDAVKAGKFFRMYRDDIETDDKGKATNLKAVIVELKKDFPELFKSNTRGGGDGGQGSGNGDGKSIDGDMNSALRRMAGRK